MGAGNRKSILIIDNSIAITGALKAIVNATSHLSTEFRFIFVLPQKTTAAEFVRANGFEVHKLPFSEISKRPQDLILYAPYLLLNAIRLKKMANRYGVQVVHVNDFYNMVGIGAKLLGANYSIITHVRFMPQRFMAVLANTWAKLNLQYAQHIICVSEAVRAFFPVVDKVIVIPDPIPESENHPVKVISTEQQQDKEVHLLYLSNFIRGKGQDYALTAFKEAYKINKRLRLAFAGGDMGLEKNQAFKAELQQDVVNSGLEKVVTFEKFVQDVESRMKAADILLNFSESESFSLTCLDALFYGVPLIASDCGGPAELFENGKSGYLVPNKDLQEMKNAILKLASNLKERKMFAEAGKYYVRYKFSAEKSYSQLNNLYVTYTTS